MPSPSVTTQSPAAAVSPTISGPVLVVVMDGIGLRSWRFGNAVALAKTPHLTRLLTESLSTTLMAHGTAVGLPSDDDLGNSEVGHNALGAGRIFDQGAKLVNQAVESGRLFQGAAWREVVQRVTSRRSTLHLLGLLSDGNVHSHERHLHALIRRAKVEGIHRVRIHVLLDGRDVSARSAEVYLARLAQVLGEVCDGEFDAAVASGGGRMRITMDRYGADWGMVKRGWDTHVLGRGPNFPSPEAALSELRRDPNLTDQDIAPFVIADATGPIGRIEDGDGVILFNFRGDRAIEISRAFTEANFAMFDRERNPDVLFAGMMEYDGDSHIPPRYLVEPPLIDHPLTEYLLSFGVRQFACSETQKFGHVTYFWNGNRSGYFDATREEYVEVPSDPADQFASHPAMQAKAIADVTIDRIRRRTFDFGRINFANGDMVGHTGQLEAAVAAVEAVDRELGRLIEAADAHGVTLVVTADHGNADEMFDAKPTEEPRYPHWEHGGSEARPRPRTSHTLAPVPLVIHGKRARHFRWANLPGIKTLGSVANTVIALLGLPPCETYLPSLVAPTVPAADLDAAAGAFRGFAATIAQLRDPSKGCPWDLKQDHLTLRRYMIEEAYEAVEAMSAADPKALTEELGDVLLQVVLNAQVAQDGGAFSLIDVIQSIDGKMRRRHPHVFDPAVAGSPAAPTSAAAVRQSWETIKAAEKAATPPDRGFFADLSREQPASHQAVSIGKRAAKIAFDWASPLDVLAQVRAELDELEVEIKAKKTAAASAELGDVYFSLAQLARHLGVDPEVTALDANRKFLRRFRAVEALAKARGLAVTAATNAQLEELWRAAKAAEDLAN